MLPINDVSHYLTGTRILLIDDSESFQRLTSEMLKKAGVAFVIVASTLAEGMHLMHYNQGDQQGSPVFDLAMMDVNLPDGNGVKGCKFISSHAATYDIPVVVITGTSMPLITNEAFEAVASDYLQKPLILNLLKMRLGSLLKLKAMEQPFSNASAGFFLTRSGM
jgi:CheY-like chemotaxis protein